MSGTLIRTATACLASASLILAAAPAVAASSSHPRPPQAAAPSRGIRGPVAIDVQRQADGTYTVSWAESGSWRVYASTQADAPARTGVLVGVVDNGVLSVANLSPDARWYFEVVVDGPGRHHMASRGTVASTRGVGLDSTTNTRDLGGYRTVDGRSVRWGQLFRSDALLAPTSRDLAILDGMELRTSVDFRSAGEVTASGPNQLPPYVRQYSVPLIDASTDALSLAIQKALREGNPQAVEDLLGDGKARLIARDGIVSTVLGEAGRAGFGETIKILVTRDGSPMIFNCTAGKDRTGIFAAILLRALGVPEETVIEDYVLSNQYRARLNQATYQRLSAAGVDIELIRPLLEQDGDNLAHMFRAIEAEYGSFDNYLIEGLGLDRQDVRTLQAKFLVS